MGFQKARILHVFVGLGLLACAICPVMEIALHSTSCIFVTGEDTESVVALLLLIVELVLVLGRLIVLLSPAIFKKVNVIYSRQLNLVSFESAATPLNLALPSPLRI